MRLKYENSCVAFDMANQRCYRRELSYFSEHGKVLPKQKVLPVLEAK